MPNRQDSNSNPEDVICILETKLREVELERDNNRIRLDSLARENQSLKDLLIEALCKVAKIEHDL
jgi:hypothetical protein